ncbi:AAA family ATPase [Herbaspirillum sp. SJZ107]|uniref:AAA family ATPase n=1 Tax=Herbaspirillum sp. SJZ107 TaxID=2572881 RepID=UPI00116DEC62|nr:AAA family ATPase [Herbaspirillum sp. SJZ107]TQK07274.1 putative AbiEii toxin of type IV toxin-antitoxin system [Herbaspirillum sp. SJZ107]
MFNLSFTTSQGYTQLILSPGNILFVVGANGTGKSSLMNHFYRQNVYNAKQISAHRQTWFMSGAPMLSAYDKKNIESSMQNQDANTQTRWMDHYPSQRASITIYDLIDAENSRARKITDAFENNRFEEAQRLSLFDAPLKAINELLAQANIPIKIFIREADQMMATKSGGAEYSIAELSDGERNALLIAANVLTVKPGTLILIDEPERHLHRSIISPLLTQLFAKRTDCAFVVSTHDVMLPIDNPASQAVLVRGCTYSGALVTSWDADVVDANETIDETLKQDILGSRRKIIFVEGSEISLDKPLYSLIFPFVSILPKSSCHEVERAVVGIRDVQTLHWVSAWGIVDNDRRSEEEIRELQSRGVYALPVFSVESIFYHPHLQRLVAEKHAVVVGGDAQHSISEAKSAALNAIKPHVNRLSERAIEKTLRDEMFKHLPRRQQISAGQPIKVEIDLAEIIREERERFSTMLEEGNLQKIISLYPVRETPALDQIAEKLGFRGRLQYENAVRKLINDSEEALNFVRSMFGTLVSEINNSLS